MNVHVRNIVFDCGDARELARFYAGMLGWRIIREDWFVVAEDEDSALRIAFEEVEGYRPPVWPDPERVYPQQMHLCLGVDDSAAAQARALRLGAKRLPDLGGSCPVFADPAGHPFCLCASGE